MICSKEELGIPEDLEEKWIWILQTQTQDSRLKTQDETTIQKTIGDFDDITDKDLGTSLEEKYPWLNNWVLVVENKTITHRPDLFGHFGISNELSTIFSDRIQFHGGKKYVEQMQQAASIYEILDNSTKANIDIVAETEKLHTYTLLEINNVTRQTSDLYLRSMMYDMGLQPRSNWVDFSNIFMYLSGQPIHFFDAGKIDGDIIIRQANP